MSAGNTGSGRRTGTPGVAARVAFSRQPAGFVSGANATTQPLVEVRDAFGAVISGSSANVIIAKERGVGTVGTTLTVAASSGITTFTDIKVTTRGRHTLLASSSGLISAQSIEFSVGNLLLLESGDYLLQETGDLTILEG